jgi:hypothetical protein
MSPVERTGGLEIVAHHGSCIAAASKSWSFDARNSSRLRIGNEIVWSAVIKGTEIKRRR